MTNQTEPPMGFDYTAKTASPLVEEAARKMRRTRLPSALLSVSLHASCVKTSGHNKETFFANIGLPHVVCFGIS